METLQEKIISLELTKPSELNLEEKSLNGNEDGDETVSEPATPSEEKTIEEGLSNAGGKKKRRKKSKRGKH